jgi:hypothetical protein
MYFAYATKPDECHHGSTKLHMDLTDAWNIKLWGAVPQPDQAGYGYGTFSWPAMLHFFASL